MARSFAPPLMSRLAGDGRIARYGACLGRTDSQRTRLSAVARKRLGRGLCALGSVSACLFECRRLTYFVKCIIPPGGEVEIAQQFRVG
jgi:hypothetical protein